jgi:hypothetical protein
MKLKLLVSRAGIGFAQTPGDIIEVDDAEAKRMIDANQAVAVEPEKATAHVPRGLRKSKSKDKD